MFLEIDEYALKKEQNLNWIIITQQMNSNRTKSSELLTNFKVVLH